MLPPRQVQTTVRLMLAWWLAFLGVAVASPGVAPTSTHLVCSAAGPMKLVVVDAVSTKPQGKASLDCPLCMPSALANGPHAWRLPTRPVPVPGPAQTMAAPSDQTPWPWQARAPPA